MCFTKKARDLYPNLAAAKDAMESATAAFYKALVDEFPIGSRVNVTHHLGEYVGEIVGHDDLGRLRVKNLVTHKITKPYPLMVAQGKPCIVRLD